jgi:hypothetical protein
LACYQQDLDAGRAWRIFTGDRATPLPAGLNKFFPQDNVLFQRVTSDPPLDSEKKMNLRLRKGPILKPPTIYQISFMEGRGAFAGGGPTPMKVSRE